MKKKLFAIIITVCMTLVPSSVWAQALSPIELQLSEINPTPYPGGIPKSPITVPSLSLNDHTLYFDTPCDGCTLNIVDENELPEFMRILSYQWEKTQP